MSKCSILGVFMDNIYIGKLLFTIIQRRVEMSKRGREERLAY